MKKANRLITLLLSAALVFAMAITSVFAYTGEERLEILTKAQDTMQIAYDLMMEQDDEGDSIYTDKTIEAVEKGYFELGGIIIDNKDKELTDEMCAEMDAKADSLKAACDAVVLKTTIKVTGTSKTFKQSKLKKKAQTFNLKAKVSSGAKAKFKKLSGSSKLKISSAGKVTVKKGTKKGTYSIKVKVSAASKTVKGKKAEAKSKPVTVTVKVKK